MDNRVVKLDENSVRFGDYELYTRRGFIRKEHEMEWFLSK